MIFNLARLFALFCTLTTLSAASLRQLWSVDVPFVASGAVSAHVLYGADSSVGLSAGGAIAWISSEGKLLYALQPVNGTSAKIDNVSNSELLFRAFQFSGGGTTQTCSVFYLTNSAGLVNLISLGVVSGSNNDVVENPVAQLQGNSHPVPLLLQFLTPPSPNNTKTTITCYTVDGTGFAAVNPTTAAPNSLSSPTLSKTGFSVTASTTAAASFTIQLSTNLSDWQNVITIEAPKPSQTVTVPLNGQPSLFLRLSGQ